jgi:hypothetical protein
MGEGSGEAWRWRSIVKELESVGGRLREELKAGRR